MFTKASNIAISIMLPVGPSRISRMWTEAPFRDFIINPGPDYDREAITRIITTHNTYDPKKIKAMLDLGVPSMTSGVL